MFRMASSSLLFLSCLGLVVASAAPEEKLTAEELIRRHLASIGSEGQISGLRSLALKGVCRYRVLVGGAGDVAGEAQVVSQEKAYNVAFTFGLGNYGGEFFVTDGKKAATGYSVPGARYPLAEFMQAQRALLTEGLFAGGLSTAWALHDTSSRKPRLKYRGLNKVDGRELHELEYGIRRGGDLKVRLFFDPETYQHVLSTHEVAIAAGLGADPSASVRQRPTRYKIEERFGEFKDMGGLTLPSSWTLQFSQQETAGAILLQWETEFSESAPNMEIPPQMLQVP